MSPPTGPPAIRLRRLDGTPDDLHDLQRVLEAVPRHARCVTGMPPGASAARDLFAALPDGRTYADKFVLGVFEGASMIGCVDLIRGHPDAATAHVGLLLVDEAHEGRGVGGAAFDEVARRVRAWDGCTRIRLGVVDGNERARRFWERLGFVPDGEVRPWHHGAVTSRVVFFARAA